MTLPNNLVKTTIDQNGRPVLVDGKVVWSGTNEFPPNIGDKVECRFNDLGSGEVSDYFVERGYLGIIVNLDNPPEWHQKQCKGQWYEGQAILFGWEINQEDVAPISLDQTRVNIFRAVHA